MKQPMISLALFALITFSAGLRAQTFFPDIWRAVEFSGFRLGQDVCQEYILDLDDNGTGKFTISIYFSANDERYLSQYWGMAPFTFVREKGDESLILVSFEALQFTFEEMPKYDPYHHLPEHLSYLEEWKRILSGKEVRFLVYSEENRGEVLEMPSFLNMGDPVYFRQGTQMGSCDAMRRN